MSKSYRAYVANLRAIGCPETTIEDIVRGDTGRAFSWERRQLGLDGSGSGPWSRAQESQLVADLLGTRSAGQDGTWAPTIETAGPGAGSRIAQSAHPVPGTENGSAAYPLFLQNPDWSALGFNADQQAAIAQVRQQFESQLAGSNETGSDNSDAASKNSASAASAGVAMARWQQALKNADNQLRDLLGAPGYLAYEQQQYYAWYQPQVIAASASGKALIINPDAFTLK